MTAFVLLAAVVGCARPSRPEPVQTRHDATDVEATSPPPQVDASRPASNEVDAGVIDAATSRAARPDAAADPPRVKVVTIGMHVGGGPFDEPTKEPFKRAVEPHFPELAQCWASHVAKPSKQTDVGVDLLIEGSGGRPKVSNPRSTLEKTDSAALLQCVITVFEAVEFPKLDRGRTGVSYSLRFTPR